MINKELTNQWAYQLKTDNAEKIKEKLTSTLGESPSSELLGFCCRFNFNDIDDFERLIVDYEITTQIPT